MNLKAMRAAALKAAQEVAAKAQAEGRALTADEQATIAAKTAEVRELDGKIAEAAKSAALLDDLAGLKAAGDDDEDDDEDEGPAVARFQVKDRRERADEASFGVRFIKSAPYEAFRKQHASGVGQGTPISIGNVKVGDMEGYFHARKAPLTSPVARAQPTRFPTLDMVERPELTLLDLVSRGSMSGNSFEYVQITSVTRNAAIVPEDTTGTDAAALKPTSELATQLADAKAYTYADGYDVTNQLLADAPAFATYMDAELKYSLDSVLEDKLLNGSGLSGEPRGILNTTGIQEVNYTAGTDAMPVVKAVRRAITAVTRLRGGRVEAVVMSPEDDENLDLMQDADGKFYGAGPWSSGPGTIWGRPRIVSERLTPGELLLGDFKQVALLDREGLSVLAFNQHKDYAQRNMTYVRAELRAAQVIWKPSRLAVVRPAAGI